MSTTSTQPTTVADEIDPEAVRLIIRERDSLARRCTLRFEETEKLRAEIDRLTIECDAMRPVVEAARALATYRAGDEHPHATAEFDHLWRSLITAVDALDGAS